MKASFCIPLRFPSLVLIFLLAGFPLFGEEKGAWIERNEGRMNLLIEDEHFELHFYDGEGEPVQPDAAQAILHCTSRVVRSRETLALVPAENDEKTILTSPRIIRPPYQFDILLVLNFDDDNRKPESHHLVFIQNQ